MNADTYIEAVNHISMLTGLCFESQREKELIHRAIFNAGLNNYHKEAQTVNDRLYNEIFEYDVIYYYKINILHPIDDYTIICKLRDEHNDIMLKLLGLKLY